MTMIGLCDCYNDPTRDSMVGPIAEFMDKKKETLNDEMPMVTLIDAYNAEGQIVRVLIFNLIAEDLPYLNDAERRFLVDGIKQKYVTPIFGIVKDTNDLHCAMALYYHEVQMQVITPAVKEVLEAILKAQIDDEPCYLCTRVSLDDNADADVTELYRLKMRSKNEQMQMALEKVGSSSDDDFYQRGCHLSDRLSDSDFMIIHGVQKESMLN